MVENLWLLYIMLSINYKPLLLLFPPELPPTPIHLSGMKSCSTVSTLSSVQIVEHMFIIVTFRVTAAVSRVQVLSLVFTSEGQSL